MPLLDIKSNCFLSSSQDPSTLVGVGYLKSDASKCIGIRQNNILTQSILILILILSDSNES